MRLLHRIDACLTHASSMPGRNAFWLFILGLAIRGGFALWLPNDILWLDGQRYVKIAESLLAGHGFGTLEMNKIAVPSQPLLIAAFKILFGGSYTMVRIGFAVLGASTCVLAYLLGNRLFDARTGLLAGTALAFYPMHAYMSALFEVPQPVFVLLIAGAFLCLYRAYPALPARGMIVAGALFGVSALSVPTVLPFLPCVLLWIAIAEPRKSRWLKPMAAFSIGAAIALSPWALRNYAAYGYPILVNLAGGENFWKANSTTYFEHGKLAVALPCEGGTRGEAYCAELAAVEAEAARRGLTENEAIIFADRAAWQGGLRLVRENPARFLQLTGRKFLSLFSPRPDAVSSASRSGSSYQLWAGALTYLPALVLGVLGLVRTHRRWREFLPIYLYLLTLIVLYSLFVPTIRYRLPIDFFLILFAAHWSSEMIRARTAEHLEPAGT